MFALLIRLNISSPKMDFQSNLTLFQLNRQSHPKSPQIPTSPSTFDVIDEKSQQQKMCVDEVCVDTKVCICFDFLYYTII